MLDPAPPQRYYIPKYPRTPSLKQSHNDPELPTASGQASCRSLCPGTNKVKGLEPPRDSSSAYQFGFLEPAAWPLEAQVHQCPPCKGGASMSTHWAGQLAGPGDLWPIALGQLSPTKQWRRDRLPLPFYQHLSTNPSCGPQWEAQLARMPVWGIHYSAI